MKQKRCPFAPKQPVAFVTAGQAGVMLTRQAQGFGLDGDEEYIPGGLFIDGGRGTAQGRYFWPAHDREE
jgi:hypothetical protein